MTDLRPSGADALPTPVAILARIVACREIDLDGFRLSLWSGLYTAPVFARIEREHGLLRDENNLLFCLSSFGSLTAKSVSEVLGRPKNSISRAVEHLLQRGLIRRSPVETDRRRALLSIEPDGRALIEATTALFVQRQEQMLSALSPVERLALDAILAKLFQSPEAWYGVR